MRGIGGEQVEQLTKEGKQIAAGRRKGSEWAESHILCLRMCVDTD